MTIVAWFKTLSTLITIVDKILDAVEAHRQREQGRIQLLIELRQKRDQEKLKAHEVDGRPVPPDDNAVIGSL
jgi:hypothetical protein